MEITPEIVKQVANNARLKLKEEEIKKFVTELQEIFQKFEILQKADVKGVKPSFHPIELKNITRPDEPGECVNREDALNLTQHRTDKYFKGPKV